MKHARVRYQDQTFLATEADGKQLRLADGRLVAQDDVTWLPPIEPRTVFTLAINYADHAKELAFKAPEEPLGFLKGANTFIGHKQQTMRPDDVTYMHYECELVAVIGAAARNVRAADAYDYVAGYTVANDYALRDYL
ncbi:MAG: fumarylacetoacetate hydrolase family protein, partial [Pigmentiphaga sp.]